MEESFLWGRFYSCHINMFNNFMIFLPVYLILL
uniref:Uncharacterized protein n=1 Tax=Rhizophora mucronata TaxID=61149 RepID=A0A2P2IPA2_RHIMU